MFSLCRKIAANAAIVGLIALGAAAHALPAFKTQQATLQSPSTALSTFIQTPASPTAKSAANIAPEIQQLARSLKHDPDLIYEYVRNNIDFYPTFGLGKGGVGALLDQSGTALDQAHLMVELLRVDDPGTPTVETRTARYVLGTINISGSAFTSWFGISQPDLARKVLANGGIPADVVGTTSIASVTMLHAWVEVQINGTWYAFDPANKSYTIQTGPSANTLYPHNAATVRSTLLGSYQTGTGTAGKAWFTNLPMSALNTQMNSQAVTLLGLMRASYSNYDIDQLLSTRVLAPWTAGPLRQTAIPGQITRDRVWSGELPNVVRTSVRVRTFRKTSTTYGIDYTYFLDDVAGRRVTLRWMNYEFGGYRGPAMPFPVTKTRQDKLLLYVGHTSVSEFDEVATTTPLKYLAASYSAVSGDVDNGAAYTYEIKLDINHPYAANSGGYADETEVKVGSRQGYSEIVATTGETTTEQVDRYSRAASLYLRRNNFRFGEYCVIVSSGFETSEQCSPHPEIEYGLYSTGAEYSNHNYELAADKDIAWRRWAANTTGVVRFLTSLEGAVIQIHHVLGVSTATSANSQFDINTVSSTELQSGDANRRKAVIATLATFSSGLEVGQPVFATDASARAGNKIWSVPSGTLGTLGAFPAGDTAFADQFLQATPSHTLVLPEDYRPVKSSSGLGYSNFADYAQTGGESNNGSPWFIAYTSDYSSIAHMVGSVLGNGSFTKGGTVELRGTPSQMAIDLDPTRGIAARDVNGQTGELTYSPAPDVTDGAGAFPYSLSFQRTYRSGAMSALPLGAGWSHNFDIFASTSLGSTYGEMQSERFGRFSIYRAASTIVALRTMVDLAAQGSSAENWVTMGNVYTWWSMGPETQSVTINQNLGGVQFVKLADGSFDPPPSHAGQLTYEVSTNRYFYIAPDGQVVTFTKIVPTAAVAAEAMGQNLYYATAWVFPQGITINFDYRPDTGTLQTVRNNLGRKLTFNYLSLGICANISTSDPYFGYDGAPCDMRNAEYNRLRSVENSSGHKVQFNMSEQYISSLGASPTRVMLDSVQHSYSGLGLSDPKVIYQYADLRLVKVFDLHNATAPVLDVTYFANDGFVVPRVESVKDANAAVWRYRSNGSRFELEDPTAAGTLVYFDRNGRTSRSLDPVGRPTTTEYDGRGRVKKQTPPSGVVSVKTYDTRSNVIESRLQSPIVTDPDIVEKWIFPVACTTLTRAWCNQPVRHINARGKYTRYDYFLSTGRVSKITNPADSDSVLGYKTFTYNAYGQPLTETDEVGRVTSYEYYPVNVSATAPHNRSELRKTIQDSAGLNYVTEYTYNAVGDVLTVKDARNNTWTGTYDTHRRLTAVESPDPDGAGPEPKSRAEVQFDVRGLVTYQRARRTDGTWAQQSFTYDPVGRQITATDPSGDVTRTTYDLAGRVEYVADGMGRAQKTEYFADGQVKNIIRGHAYSTSTGLYAATALAQVYQANTYSMSGLLDSTTDANGNKTFYTYDGFARSKKTAYPDCATAASTNCAYTENTTYDPTGNVLAFRNRAGQTFSFTYDDLNRSVRKVTPDRVENFRYDLSGLRVCAEVWPAASAVQTCNSGSPLTRVTAAYNAAGRLTSESQLVASQTRSVGYKYDAVGNRTAVIWPDLQRAIYQFDALNRMTLAGFDTNGDDIHDDTLSLYRYDALDQLTGIRRGSANWNSPVTSTDLIWEADGDLASFTQGFTGETAGWTYGYDASAKLISETKPALFTYVPGAAQTANYTLGGAYAKASLNQYGSVNAIEMRHDANGNRTLLNGLETQHDSENRLVRALKSGLDVTYIYDADGRRLMKDYTTSATYIDVAFLSAGDMEIAEYDVASGSLLRRYIPGLKVDDRVAIKEQSTGAYSYYHADRIGNVVAMTNASGTMTDRYKYTPFGIETPLDLTGNVFRYTGRRLDPETGLYHYRARYYDPSETGGARFLEVDPVGYADQMNLYAYVGNDPINVTDPSGNEGVGRHNNGQCTFAGCRAPAPAPTVEQVFDGVGLALDVVAIAADIVTVPSGEGVVAVGARRSAWDAIKSGVKQIFGKGGKGTCCFVAGTLVETEQGLKPIEQIKVGDRVWARDVKSGDTALKPVTDLIRRHDRVIWDLALSGLDGATERFETTDDHPWWIAGKGWSKTAELKPGMAVVTRDGTGMVVASVTETSRVESTYNLTVAEFETYFVGKRGVLVHNCPVGSLPKPPSGPGKVPKAERDPKRLFTPEERAIKRGEQDGLCGNGCGAKIDETNSEGHHITRHADGGRTNSENHSEVCVNCHRDLHSPDPK